MNPQTLEKAVSGDSEALSLLIDNHKDIAFNLAIGIVGNREDAKDIVQDSFLRVLENIHKFRNESKFSTWLYKIVYHESISFMRKNGKQKTDNIDGKLSPGNINNEENKIDNYRELNDAISQLAETESNLIRLFYLAEKSIKEIHQITGLSISNIKVTLYRARKKLAEKLEYETTR